jgi:DNA mismatch repair protein MutL
VTAPAAARRAIHVLPADVAARIAAGEVIERPVSVVRELLDNALDAGATRITVEIEEGGLALIRVSDDGRGIPPEEVELAFERHATSKIEQLVDLAGIRTLGFRGEALPSVAAAADVELVTRVGYEPTGVLLVIADARVVRRSARAAPQGTTIVVRDLFARIPARRKFVGTPAAEGRQVTVLVSHYALAYPGVAIHLASGGRRQLTTPGDGDLRHAFAAVHGAAMAAEMLDVSFDGEAAGVTGLAGPPPVHRGNRAAISVFVNGRWVQSRTLTFAIVDAYQTQLPVGRHPIAALALAIPCDDVDVNVHPAKAEVRFRDERAVARAVRHAVMTALESARPVSWLAAPSAGSLHVEPLAPSAAASGPTLRQRLEPPRLALSGPQPSQPRMALPGRVDEPTGTGTHRELLPLLRVVGQLGSTYVVAEGPDGMYLIDQHAAHERVVYDRLVARPLSDPATQPLLEPLLLELDTLAAAALAEHREQLASLGLSVEPFGERAWLVRAVPAGAGSADLVTGLRALLDQLAGERRVADPFGRAAATIACHSSVRAGQALALEEMRRLAEDLGATATPRTCPHGRPTLVHVASDAIERQFGRR